MQQKYSAIASVIKLVGRFGRFAKPSLEGVTVSPSELSSNPAIAPYSVPDNEDERLDVLRRYQILNTLPEAEFDDLTELAAYICGSPISLLSLTSANQQWFKSRVGLDATSAPREFSFCSHAILNPDDLMIVPNMLEDERFVDNPLVTADPSIRFYAGAPLVTPDGFPLGTLCVMDRVPRSLTPEQQKALQTLSRQAIAQMELRLTVKKLERQIVRYQQAEAKLRASDQQVVDLLEGMTDGFFALDRQGRFTFVNRKAEQILQRSSEGLLGKVIWQVLPEMANSTFKREYTKAVDQQTSVSFEEFSHPLGRWIEVRAFPSFGGISVFIHDITVRKTVEEALRYQQEQSEHLLLNILPEAIADRLKIEEEAIADSFDETTILFADLVNFTHISSQITPHELVSLLNKIFSVFDRLTEKYDLEKIKTIGDAYLVASGVPVPRRDHAEAAANIALEMQEAIQQFSTSQGDRLSLSIGINSGSVVAGIIGTKKFSYDLWGDTVNVASRMQSHASSGSIQVTEATYELLRDRYLFEKRGKIVVKGKGEMTTYLLVGKKER
ncbi:PAS domain-containing protein [Leptolyngbya sp. FACHB-541]|uniref:adenylate/guanylate cyclase domain-containing protein n=1 Tax=Leptolyngbya sp. FACHB-541 TaxID=2692810 RepID=UPI001686F7EA|nr:adenylate/guanylate cyclase domain-containing protein [Leptolyngbya sp. FACHB-541]MBD1995661.1 PAS domain-containing protein [Leptolyngbya sp. FACHB-541]